MFKDFILLIFFYQICRHLESVNLLLLWIFFIFKSSASELHNKKFIIQKKWQIKMTMKSFWILVIQNSTFGLLILLLSSYFGFREFEIKTMKKRSKTVSIKWSSLLSWSRLLARKQSLSSIRRGHFIWPVLCQKVRI